MVNVKVIADGRHPAGALRFDTLALVVTDAACTARLKGWAAVSVGRNADGRVGLTMEVA